MPDTVGGYWGTLQFARELPLPVLYATNSGYTFSNTLDVGPPFPFDEGDTFLLILTIRNQSNEPEPSTLTDYSDDLTLVCDHQHPQPGVGFTHVFVFRKEAVEEDAARQFSFERYDPPWTDHPSGTGFFNCSVHAIKGAGPIETIVNACPPMPQSVPAITTTKPNTLLVMGFSAKDPLGEFIPAAPATPEWFGAGGSYFGDHWNTYQRDAVIEGIYGPTPSRTSGARDQYTVLAISPIPAPPTPDLTVTALEPASGVIAGGTTVTVHGTSFALGATTVTIGATTIPAGSVTVADTGTELTFVTPAGPGSVVSVQPVSVTVGAYTSNIKGFTYNETGDFSPAQIDDLLFWLDQAVPSTLSTTGSAVTQWRDLSLNDFIFNSMGSNPPYTGTLNGKTVITFSADWFEATAPMLGGQPRTYSWVMNPTDITPALQGVISNINQAPRIELTSTGTLFVGAQASQTGEDTTVAAGGLHVWTVLLNSSNSEIWKDGVSVWADDAGSYIPYGTAKIGDRTHHGDQFTGVMPEVVCYRAELTTGERTALENYLVTKWTTPTAPDAPTLVSATPGDTTVALVWTAPASSTSIIDYDIEWSANGTTGWTPVGEGTLTATNYTVTGLTNGTIRYFRVSAENSIGTGAFSNVMSATPNIPPAFSATLKHADVGINQSTSSLTSYTVDDVALTAGNEVVVFLFGVVNAGTRGVSAPGFTFTQQGSHAISNLVVGNIYTATVPSTGAHDFTFSGTNILVLSDVIYEVLGGGGWGAFGLDGQYASPTFWSGAKSLTLNAAPDSDSIVIGAIQTTHGESATSITPGSGWTEDADIFETGTFNPRVEAQRRTGFTSTTVAWDNIAVGDDVFTWIAAGIEVSAPVVATVPDAPTLTSATPGNTQATLAWTAPSSNGGSAITGYLIQKSPDGTSSWTTADTVGVVLSHTVTGLANDTIQYFRVSAINAVGTGTASNVMSTTPFLPTAPGAPTLTTATPGDLSVALAWTAGTAGTSATTGYLVEQSPNGTTGWATVTTTGVVLAYTVTGLANGTIQHFRVSGVNPVGTGTASNVLSATPVATFPTIAAQNSEQGTSMGTQAINMPTGIAAGNLLIAIVASDLAAAAGTHTASTGWTSIRTQLQGSNVVRLSAFGRIADGGANDNLTVTGPSQDYCAWTGRITGFTVTAISQIQSADATAGTGNADPPNLNPTVARAWRWIAAEAMDLTTSNTITSVPSGYTEAYRNVSASSTSSVAMGVGHKTGDTTSENPGNFVNNPTTRPWVAFTIGIPNRAVVSNAPVLNTATPGSGQVALAWTAPTNDGGAAVTDYTVQYRTTAGPGSWTTFTHSVSTATTINVTGLTNGTGYDFQVAAVNVAGTGTYSNALSATPAVVPGAPTLNTATPGNTQVALAWTAPASNGGSALTDYTIQWRTTAGPGSWTTFSHGASTATSINVTGLTNGTGYDFQVAAVNIIGTGSYSGSLSATPAAGGAFTDPTSLPNLVGWWDASDASSFTYSSGVVVSQWSDKSGTAHHLTVGSGAPSRTGTQNGLPVVYFDTDSVRHLGTNLITGTTLSVFMVCDYGQGGYGFGRAISFQNDSFSADYGTQGSVAINPEGGVWPSGYSNGSQIGTPPIGVGNQWISFAYTFGGGNDNLYINGALKDTKTWAGSPWNVDNIGIGGTPSGGDFASDLHVAEIVLYSDQKTGGDLTDIFNYLNAKWAIPPPIIYEETFTYSNGTPWPDKALTPTPARGLQYNQSGAKPTVQSNRSVWVTAAPDYSEAANFIGAPNPHPTSFQWTIDTEFSHLSGSAFAVFCFTGPGYNIEVLLSSSTFSLSRSGVGVASGSIGATITVGTVLHWKIERIVNVVRARWWVGAAAEPSTWPLNYTDSTPLVAGEVLFTARTVGGGALTMYVDDIVIRDMA